MSTPLYEVSASVWYNQNHAPNKGVRGFDHYRKDKHMRLKNWRRTLLLIVLVLAACGTADSPEHAVSDSGVVASITPDGAYPPPAQTPATSPATQPIPTATSDPTTVPTLAATEDMPSPQPTERAPETAEREPTPPQTTIFYEQTTAVMTPTTVVSIEENESPLKLFAWSFDSQYLFFGREAPDISGLKSEYDLYIFDLTTYQETFVVSRVVQVLPSPTKHEYILIQQRPTSEVPHTQQFDLLHWSLHDKDMTKLYSLSKQQYGFNEFVWNGTQGVVFQDREHGGTIAIEPATGHVQASNDIPSVLKAQFPDSTWRVQIAPAGVRSYLINDLQQTLVLREGATIVAQMPFDDSYSAPEWSSNGDYLYTYNSFHHNHVDVYTFQGTPVYRLQSLSGIILKTWNEDNEAVIVTSYDNGGSHPSTSFLINLEQETSARLNFEGVPDYAYTDTILWSPSDRLLAVDYTARNFRPENTPFFGLSIYHMYTAE